jgi:hypothetical protein
MRRGKRGSSGNEGNDVIGNGNMDKERLKELAEDPRFIQGIYNYCDRWCERCPFTSRCMNFALSEEEFEDPESNDVRNEQFWRKMRETFQLALDLLKDLAEREGIDLDSLDVAESEEEHRARDALAGRHRCSLAAKLYGEMADDWFEAADDLSGRNDEDPTLDGVFGSVEMDPTEGGLGLHDAVEVVRWYQHQIYVKIMRAVRGSLDERQESPDEFPKDSDGSAKVALIGIDRSIAAWREIRERFPAQAHGALDILLHLRRVRKEVEKAFPDARAFLRPGFDRIDLNG